MTQHKTPPKVNHQKNTHLASQQRVPSHALAPRASDPPGANHLSQHITTLRVCVIIRTTLLYFEGVCLTTVILAPGACGGRLRAAPRDIKSPDAASAAGAPECHEKRVLYLFYQSRRTLTPPLNPPKSRHSSGRLWESLWEGLEELWESFGRLWRSSGRPWESSGRVYIYKNSRSTAPADVMLPSCARGHRDVGFCRTQQHCVIQRRGGTFWRGSPSLDSQ